MGRKKKYLTEEERKAANREKVKRFYQKNPEKYKEFKDYQKRWYQENIENLKDYQNEYRNTPMGRAVSLVSSYQQADKNANRGECTLTAQWVVDNIFTKPCHYCGKEGWNVVGCDRIDNDLPHTEDNVVPCCYECNTKRNIMNYEKFKQITIPCK